MSIFSSNAQLQSIKSIIASASKLPFVDINIPGAMLENILAEIRGAKALRTYDFIDVLDKKNQLGWQVKSTLASTPVTWKRAKIPNQQHLIKKSHESKEGLQDLGNAIIDFCNSHAQESYEKYYLKQIGYSRLIIHEDNTATYFEKILSSSDSQNIFNKNDFIWNWSVQKNCTTKEQLSALHGINKTTKKKWWAWHGLGENQLHFSGESTWWPTDDAHKIDILLAAPDKKLSYSDLIKILN